jgi:hypothetical protein
MSEPRPKLTLRLGNKSPEQKEADTIALLSQAIQQHLCVRWTYNRTHMRAAPQILYRKNDRLYCDAVVVERNGAAPAELKLASFNLSGLDRLLLTQQVHPAWSGLEFGNTRYAGGILAQVSD